MKRQRASGREAAEIARLKLDGRPLSKEQAKRTADLAAAWLEHDAWWAIKNGEFIPDPPGAGEAARAASLAELETKLDEIKAERLAGVEETVEVHTDSLPPPRLGPEEED